MREIRNIQNYLATLNTCELSMVCHQLLNTTIAEAFEGLTGCCRGVDDVMIFDVELFTTYASLSLQNRIKDMHYCRSLMLTSAEFVRPVTPLQVLFG